LLSLGPPLLVPPLLVLFAQLDLPLTMVSQLMSTVLA
jgi:hypothetical protein